MQPSLVLIILPRKARHQIPVKRPYLTTKQNDVKSQEAAKLKNLQTSE